jgi:hypothetical protein
MQKHRISTRIGFDQKIIVELKNDFDLLEILSLKFTQSDIYTSMCSDYGVVVGRISVNNGLGVPNARVSIFIPITEEDKEDPVISQLYPYTDISDKNENGYRYNLLPSRKQHGGHSPTGTFPDQKDVLNREEILEVYEKYYKYTVKTNNSGDFMIWGVPIGTQTIHVDTDLSDVGCFSLRPDDFIRQGIGVDSFKNEYTFKTSEDIDSLPQIVTFDQTIDVYPFWGNEELCEIGITRTDFDLSNKGIRIEPKAYLIGGTFTDLGKTSVNKNCVPTRKMGRKCDLVTKTGKIEAIRFTSKKDNKFRPILENVELNEDIDEDGSFILPITMNMDYLYTNEFGENEYTNDTNKGVPTSSCYRFRFSLSDDGLERVRTNADYLVPNIREYIDDVDRSYSFSTNYEDYPEHAVKNFILNNENGFYYPQDYFYKLNYNKVYTVSSFQETYFPGQGISDTFKDRFLGLKELVPSEEEDCAGVALTPPVNYGFKNYTFQLLIADVLLFFEQLIILFTLLTTNTIVYIIHGLANIFDNLITKKISKSIRKSAYRLQNETQRNLYLITYPECEECTNNEYGTEIKPSNPIERCKVGELEIQGSPLDSSRILIVDNDSYISSTFGTICSGATLIWNIDQCNSAINFVNNQEDYELLVTIGAENFIVELSNVSSPDDTGFEIISFYDSVPNCTGYTLTFQDPDRIFNEDTTYLCTIRDKNYDITLPTTINLEEGCSIYDVPYDSNIISKYYVGENRTEYLPLFLPPNSDIKSTKLSDNEKYGLPILYERINFKPITPINDDGFSYSEFSNGIFYIIPGTLSYTRIFAILKEYRRRKRVALMFCGGIVNYSFINNWLSGSLYFFQFKSKVRWNDEESLNLNYNRTNYCKDLVYYKVSETNSEIPVKRFYYRSSNFDINSTPIFGERDIDFESPLIVEYYRLNHPTTMVDLGPRDEFIKEICTDPSLDPNCSVVRSIGPSSFQNFGELLGLVINYRLDSESKSSIFSEIPYSLDNFFSNGGASFFGFKNVLSGDILQLISINNEVGIEEFNLQNQNYLGYSYEMLDPDTYPDVFKNNTSVWGPTPITLQFSEDGARIRYCLNDVGRLTESSQVVPFFLWDKKGTGFGPYNENNKNSQFWNLDSPQSQPLQGMTYGYNLTGVTDNPSDKYLLPPITYTFSGLTITGETNVIFEFDVIEDSATDNHLTYDNQYPGFTYLWVTGGTISEPTSGILYTRYGSSGTWDSLIWNSTKIFIIKKTQDYYSGNKQILSTPFHFYFGLRPGNTGVDKFIKRFGPLGAFPSAE